MITQSWTTCNENCRIFLYRPQTYQSKFLLNICSLIACMTKDQGLTLCEDISINLSELNLRGRLNQDILVRHRAAKVPPEPINIFYWTRRKMKEESSQTPRDFIKSCSSFTVHSCLNGESLWGSTVGERSIANRIWDVWNQIRCSAWPSWNKAADNQLNETIKHHAKQHVSLLWTSPENLPFFIIKPWKCKISSVKVKHIVRDICNAMVPITTVLILSFFNWSFTEVTDPPDSATDLIFITPFIKRIQQILWLIPD